MQAKITGKYKITGQIPSARSASPPALSSAAVGGCGQFWCSGAQHHCGVRAVSRHRVLTIIWTKKKNSSLFLHLTTPQNLIPTLCSSTNSAEMIQTTDTFLIMCDFAHCLPVSQPAAFMLVLALQQSKKSLLPLTDTEAGLTAVPQHDGYSICQH